MWSCLRSTTYCTLLLFCVVFVLVCVLPRLCCYGNTGISHWPRSVHCGRVECICALLCASLSEYRTNQRLSETLMISVLWVLISLIEINTNWNVCHTHRPYTVYTHTFKNSFVPLVVFPSINYSVKINCLIDQISFSFYQLHFSKMPEIDRELNVCVFACTCVHAVCKLLKILLTI